MKRHFIFIDTYASECSVQLVHFEGWFWGGGWDLPRDSRWITPELFSFDLSNERAFGVSVMRPVKV